MSKMTRFLDELGRNGDLANAFERTPDQVLARFNFSKSEHKAVRGGDVDEIRSVADITGARPTRRHISTYEP